MMNRAKRLLAVPACLLAVACVAGLSASPALADWQIEGKAISESVEVEAENDGEEFGFLVPKLNFQLVFKKITYDKVSLNKGGTTSEVFLFTEGTAYTISPKTLWKACEPGDLTFVAKGSLFLHNGKTYERFENLTGQPLTVTTYSEECPIGEKIIVVGSVVLESVGSSFETEAVSHLVRQAPESLFPGKLNFGASPMNFIGSWIVKLKGKEAGKKWSGVI
jgi:hypothetical protein